MQVLHITATPRGPRSNSLRVARAFLAQLASRREDLVVDELDLFAERVPEFGHESVDTKYALMAGQRDAATAGWGEVEALIARFLAADAYVLSCPMWNFGVPYVLKHYIDCLVQPGYTFRYDATGMVVPLVEGRRMLCVASRGTDYSAGGPMRDYDFQEPYLRTIFGFVGITDIEVIRLESTDVSAQRDAAYAAALTSALVAAAKPGWSGPAVPDQRGAVRRPSRRAGGRGGRGTVTAPRR